MVTGDEKPQQYFQVVTSLTDTSSLSPTLQARKFKGAYHYTFFLTIIYVCVACRGVNVCLCFYALCLLAFVVLRLTAHTNALKAPLTWTVLDTPYHQGATCGEHVI